MIAVGASLVAASAAWGVGLSLADDPGGSAFVSGFVLALVNTLVGLAAGVVVFGAARTLAVGARRVSRS